VRIFTKSETDVKLKSDGEAKVKYRKEELGGFFVLALMMARLAKELLWQDIHVERKDGLR